MRSIVLRTACTRSAGRCQKWIHLNTAGSINEVEASGVVRTAALVSASSSGDGSSAIVVEQCLGESRIGVNAK